MLPFCGYHLGQYLEHWLDLGTRLTPPPRMYYVNWFRRCPHTGRLIWPGFSHNLKVLAWIYHRCRSGSADSTETPIGHVPLGLECDPTLLQVIPAAWLTQLEQDRQYLLGLGSAVPQRLLAENATPNASRSP